MKVAQEIQNTIDLWFKWDQNPASRQEIQTLIDNEDVEELTRRFEKRIGFGTAGLREVMKSGIAYMNNITVQQASQGLSKYLIEKVSDVKERGVCIGYDGRHNSLEYAKIASACFIHEGIKVYLFNQIVPTPFVAFAVKDKKLPAGIMITASHNPKEFNGYKVYWDSGSQIVSPVDAEIAASIQRNADLWTINTENLLDSPLVKDETEAIASQYYKICKEKCLFHPHENSNSSVKIVFTPMHGVGGKWVKQIFEEFSLQPFIPVEKQFLPDPEFPTVAFPNPEEGAGALQLAMETADAHGARVIIANDPDSDRLAAAEKKPDGSWHIFKGDELGIIFADWCWTKFKQNNPNVNPHDCVVLNSTVSSKMLKAIADTEGLQYEETLTGFKWLGNLAKQRIDEGKHFLFAYEEAIGFMLFDVCLDKDGVRAAASFAEMSNQYYAKGHTVLQQLEQLRIKYGYFGINNHYYFCHHPPTMRRIFDDIRKNGYPEKIGNFNVAHVRDLGNGYDSRTPSKKAELPWSSSNMMYTFYFENGGTITLRASGTEPKLKWYAELKGTDKATVDATLREMVDATVHTLLKPKENNLKPPAE